MSRFTFHPAHSQPRAGAPVAPIAPDWTSFHGFLVGLDSLDVPPRLSSRLEVFLAARHPGEQDRIYHGLAHSHEVAALTARLLAGRPLVSAGDKVMLALAAALHDVDPRRAPNTPARVAATLAHLDSDREARDLLHDFGTRFRFDPARVKALILATDYSADPAERAAKWAAFERASARAGEPGDEERGRLLAFADRIATYLLPKEQARRRVKGLALEFRTAAGGRGQGPTNRDVLSGSGRFLDELRANPLFAALSKEDRQRFAAAAASFEPAPTLH